MKYKTVAEHSNATPKLLIFSWFFFPSKNYWQNYWIIPFWLHKLQVHFSPWQVLVPLLSVLILGWWRWSCPSCPLGFVECAEFPAGITQDSQASCCSLAVSHYSPVWIKTGGKQGIRGCKTGICKIINLLLSRRKKPRELLSIIW